MKSAQRIFVGLLQWHWGCAANLRPELEALIGGIDEKAASIDGIDGDLRGGEHPAGLSQLIAIVGDDGEGLQEISVGKDIERE